MLRPHSSQISSVQQAPDLRIMATDNATKVATMEEWFRNRAQRLKNPSKRTPDRETDYNSADCVEREMEKHRVKTWGWVIYRCTYQSDAQWNAFMDRLSYYIDATLRANNGLDLKSSLDVQAMEDKDTFDGASPGQVREVFREWVGMASRTEPEQFVPVVMRSPRYNYCLHVDQGALDSILSGPAPPGDETGDGYVNLVYLNRHSNEDTSGLRPSHDPDWMRITYRNLMVSWYRRLDNTNTWETERVQPPEVAHP